MRSPDAYRMHRRMVFRPNKFCFGRLDIEYPCNLLNNSWYLLDTSALHVDAVRAPARLLRSLFLPTAHPPQLEKDRVHFI